MNLSTIYSVIITLVLSTLHGACYVSKYIREVAENLSTETCDRNIVIIVIGKNSTDVSSVIRQIIGATELSNPERNDSPVTEYIIRLDGATNLTFVDVMGLVDRRMSDNAAKILASLKSYINNPSKHNRMMIPDAFLIVSNFDDNQFIGDQSEFIQTVKRIEILQEQTFIPSIKLNNIFVMSVTRVIQRKPQQRIHSFQQIIQNFTSMSPIHLLVGENMADAENILPDGYIKLANKEIYPKNVLNKVIELLRAGDDGDCAELLENFRDNRAAYTDRMVSIYNSQPDIDEIQNFVTRIQITNFEIKNTEINMGLREAFDGISNPTLKNQIRRSVPLLQIHLQSQNITQFSQLPQRTLDKIKFFKNLPKELEIGVITLLQSSMNNFLPEFVQQMVTGSSYDVIEDKILAFSPFKRENLTVSSTGYLLPSYIICTKLSNDTPSVVDYIHSLDSYQEYIDERLKTLYFPELKTIFNRSYFVGKLKTGFNIKPEAYHLLAYLSTRREIRKFYFQLNEDKFELTDEFLQSVNSLKPLNLSKRDSVGDWKAFFNKHGTHVVFSAYVGGTVQGFLFDEILTSFTPNQTQSILQGIINFQPIRTNEKPNYQFFGGDRIAALSQLSRESDRTVTNEVKESIVKEWVDSINYDPIGLDYEIKLIPIGEILLKYNSTVAKEIEKVSKLFLAGQLVYTPASKTSTTGGPEKGNAENVTETTTTEINLLHTTVRNNLLNQIISIPQITTPNIESMPSTEKQDIEKSKNNKNRTKSIDNYDTPSFNLLNDLTVTKRPVMIPSVQINYTFPSTPIMRQKFSTNQSNINPSLLTVKNVRNMQEADDKLLRPKVERFKIESEKLQLANNFMTDEQKRQAESDRKRMQDRSQAHMYNMQQRHKEQQAILKILIEQNERELKAKEKDACLRKGTRILMADGTEKRVEELVVGDIVLDHELNQVKVIGHLEKFLLGDHFYGFSENGPFFFTNTHLLVGPGEYNGEVQLWVNSFHDFIEENPLMEYLNAKQINKSSTTYFTVDTEGRIVRKIMSVFRDSSTSPPDTMVHIIEVDSPHGTYFANGVACRHEIPPFELWPNTVSLFLRIGSYPEIEQISTFPYTLNVVHQIDEIVERIAKEIQLFFTLRKYQQLLFDLHKTHPVTTEHFEIQSNSLDVITETVFKNPTLSHFITKLYGNTGKTISSVLDNPNLALTPTELVVLEKHITNITLANIFFK